MLKMKSSTLRFFAQTMLLLFWSTIAVWASEPKGSSPHGTNIFAPASTPAKSIADLSVFVLAITGIIFVVVFALLIYAVVKFRARATDAGREPAQVYGSTQIELAWTIIPILIVVVLFLATARVIHAVRMLQNRRCSTGHRDRTSILVGVSISEAGDRHRQRTAHSGERSQSPDANVSAIALGRHRPQLLGAGAGRQDRPHSKPPQPNVDGPAAHRYLSRPVRPVLRSTARQDAAPRFVDEPEDFAAGRAPSRNPRSKTQTQSRAGECLNAMPA
jgi:hypothetical protein